MLQPLGDRVLVKRAEAKAQVGLIHIAEQHQERPQEGEVIAAGEQVVYLNPGDKVLFSKYAGVDIEDQNVAYVIMRIDEILAKRVQDTSQTS